MRKSADRALTLRVPVPPILMGARGRPVRSRSETALRLLLRFVAVLWLLEGLRQWAGVLTAPDMTYLPGASPLHMAGLFFFCTLDFVAAIGLWLVTSWGVAVWLATILGHMLALVLAPDSLPEPVLITLSDAVLVCVYVGLAWKVSREHRLA